VKPGWSFAADSLSYADADMDAVAGHRQVTDAYLVALAKHRGAKLATLDKALAALYPDEVVLVPAPDTFAPGMGRVGNT
jgi:predicted nucleic acid-binding protein